MFPNALMNDMVGSSTRPSFTVCHRRTPVAVLSHNSSTLLSVLGFNDQVRIPLEVSRSKKRLGDNGLLSLKSTESLVIGLEISFSSVSTKVVVNDMSVRRLLPKKITAV